jgi:uncharacterized RDD family membrane protein YckC
MWKLLVCAFAGVLAWGPLALGLVILHRRRHAVAKTGAALVPPNLYMGFWRRFAALIIDAGALWCVMLSVLFVLMLLGGEESMILFLILACAADPVYCIFFWKQRGATPGKMAMGLRVVRPSGKPLEWGNVLWRALPKIIWAVFLFVWLERVFVTSGGREPSEAEVRKMIESHAQIANMVFYGIFGVDAVVFFLDKRNRALHDILGGTVVVRNTYNTSNTKDTNGNPT